MDQKHSSIPTVASSTVTLPPPLSIPALLLSKPKRVTFSQSLPTPSVPAKPLPVKPKARSWLDTLTPEQRKLEETKQELSKRAKGLWTDNPNRHMDTKEQSSSATSFSATNFSANSLGECEGVLRSHFGVMANPSVAVITEPFASTSLFHLKYGNDSIVVWEQPLHKILEEPKWTSLLFAVYIMDSKKLIPYGFMTKKKFMWLHRAPRISALDTRKNAEDVKRLLSKKDITQTELRNQMFQLAKQVQEACTMKNEWGRVVFQKQCSSRLADIVLNPASSSSDSTSSDID